MNTPPTILAATLMPLKLSPAVIAMCAAGVVVSLIALWSARTDIAQATGLDKVVALANLCFAAPLAVFGAEHFGDARSIMQIVPKYMPAPLFWTYFVGVALLAASLSIATRIHLRWSGLFFGIMMFLFVAMLDLPAIPANIHKYNRFFWVLFCREPSFAAGGWMLAAATMDEKWRGRGMLVMVGRLIIGIAAVFYGGEHFLHPTNVPGVPLEKFMPGWIPGPMVISYLTGAILFIAGLMILTGKKARTAATYLGTWLVLIVVFIYGPILIAQLLDPNRGVQIEGLNYFFDTLLYAGAILALANVLPKKVIWQESSSTAPEKTDLQAVHSPGA
jgi:uncharacterized membrane protein